VYSVANKKKIDSNTSPNSEQRNMPRIDSVKQAASRAKKCFVAARTAGKA
jgi:hypothetical protein